MPQSHGVIPEGWREVADGEIIHTGDMLWRNSMNRWDVTLNTTESQHRRGLHDYFYITSHLQNLLDSNTVILPKGYQLLSGKKEIKPGDMVLENWKWRPAHPGDFGALSTTKDPDATGGNDGYVVARSVEPLPHASKYIPHGFRRVVQGRVKSGDWILYKDHWKVSGIAIWDAVKPGKLIGENECGAGGWITIRPIVGYYLKSPH
jgi:hypothetical protein